MHPIRIVVGMLPRLLLEILVDLVEAQYDMRLVGSPGDEEGLMRLLRARDADVVLLGCGEGRLPEVGDRVLDAQPRAQVLGVLPDGCDAVLYRLRPTADRLGEVSPQQLIEIVRTSMGQRWSAGGDTLGGRRPSRS